MSSISILKRKLIYCHARTPVKKRLCNPPVAVIRVAPGNNGCQVSSCQPKTTLDSPPLFALLLLLLFLLFLFWRCVSNSIERCWHIPMGSSCCSWYRKDLATLLQLPPLDPIVSSVVLWLWDWKWKVYWKWNWNLEWNWQWTAIRSICLSQLTSWNAT